MTWPLDAARGSSPREAMESASASEGDAADRLLLSLDAAKAKRVWRKAERATRARAGGNHSRVWRRMSDPLAG